MTNDAERVSDIVARLRAEAKMYGMGQDNPPRILNEAADIIESFRDAATEQSRIMADIEEKNEALQAIIEAQSKALAEARGAAIKECIALLDGLTGYTGEGTEDRNDGFAMFARGVRFAKREFAKRARALVTPTPENPNG
jgi:hypothetical protein